MKLAALLAIVLAAGSSPAVRYIVRADRTVGGLPVGRGTLAQARARFGAPAHVTDQRVTCAATWPRLGLRISFLDFAGHGCTAGGAVVVTIGDRGHWKTDRGLLVGDTAARLHTLYPRAKLHADGWWLVPRNSCKETGGQPFAGLLARAKAGKVSAFVVTAGVCE